MLKNIFISEKNRGCNPSKQKFCTRDCLFIKIILALITLKKCIIFWDEKSLLRKLFSRRRSSRFELWETVHATVRPLRLPRARSRETARSPFSDTVFTMKNLFYSNHCKLCIKYKFLTAIPDFKNDDILFIYGAMACYKKG